MSQTPEKKFNEVDWLSDDGPAALTLREYLQPVEGPDAVIFPPTFAPEQEKQGAKSNYQIDDFKGSFEAKISYQHPGDEKLETHVRHDQAINVCLIDSVGAEANRIEPLFKREEYKHLVPQVVIEAGGVLINLLDAGHRAGDALVPFSSLAERIWEGFSDLLTRNDANKLARLAPTSLVFGAWDSRGTQAKVPRIFRSVIRAFDVRDLKRSAQFIPAKDFTSPGQDLADVAAMFEGKKGDENPLSREGFLHASAVKTPGGIIVDGEIRREVTINLVAIRSLRICQEQALNKTDEEATSKLRRYILGLALLAATPEPKTNPERYNLREGCLLRRHRERRSAWTAVPFDGPDVTITDLTDALAKQYADDAARDFAVTQPEGPATFNKELAAKWLKLEKKKQDEVRRLRPMTKQQFDQPTKSPAPENQTGQPQPVPPEKPKRTRSRKNQGDTPKGDK